LVTKIDNESIEQISMYVHGMNNLGYMQRVYSQSDGAGVSSSTDAPRDNAGLSGLSFSDAGPSAGYVRWTVGNEFLRRWMLENYQDLAQTLYSDVSDYGVESLLEMGRKVELDYLQHEISELKRRLELLLAAHNNYADAPPPELEQEIQELRRELERAGGQLRNLAD
jgi:hypothetical protein